MLMLAVGLILFLGLHLVPALPDLRAALVRRLGEPRYKGAFSLLSLLGLSLIIGGYARSAPGARLFAPSPAAIAIAPYAMTLAFVLLAAANLRGHIRHSLKHPMLLGIVIWASIHLLANGDTRGTVLFGSFLGYAVLDLFSALQRHTGKHVRTEHALRRDRRRCRHHRRHRGHGAAPLPVRRCGRRLGRLRTRWRPTRVDPVDAALARTCPRPRASRV